MLTAENAIPTTSFTSESADMYVKWIIKMTNDYGRHIHAKKDRVTIHMYEKGRIGYLDLTYRLTGYKA